MSINSDQLGCYTRQQPISTLDDTLTRTCDYGGFLNIKDSSGAAK